MVNEVKDQNFEEEVLKSKNPVLIDFWAPWCGPCKTISPVIDKLSEDYRGRFKFCKINVEEAQQTASEYGIMSIPALLFFKDGKKVDQIIGAVPETSIKSKIDALI